MTSHGDMTSHRDMRSERKDVNKLTSRRRKIPRTWEVKREEVSDRLKVDKETGVSTRLIYVYGEW